MIVSFFMLNSANGFINYSGVLLIHFTQGWCPSLNLLVVLVTHQT